VAEEAMAVDRFLAERHSELRDAFSYAVLCRKWTSGDPRSVTSEQLKLEGQEIARWEAVKQRFLPPEERSDPAFRLALKLFHEVADPFALVARMTGELLRRLANREEPSAISTALYEVLSRARAELADPPPPALLDVADFTAQPGGQGILLGQRPTLQSLNAGYFMPRSDRAAAIANRIQELLAGGVAWEALPVCWLSGGSGAGKSVLLLQALEHLVRAGDVVVHHLNPTDTALQAALGYWRSPARPVVIAVDDLFAPARRSDVQWDRLGDLAMDSQRASALVIATAGPTNYLDAFRNRAQETGAFTIHELSVTGLDADERVAYRNWFAQRTRTTPPPIDEPLFIVNAFRCVVGGGASTTSVGEFASRFRSRAAAMAIEDEVLAGLAMNGRGLPAPAALFEGHLDELKDLIDETSSRCRNPTAASRR
jgi:hypothetical protein